MHALKPLLTSSVPEICGSDVKDLELHMNFSVFAEVTERAGVTGLYVPTATVLFPTEAVCL